MGALHLTAKRGSGEASVLAASAIGGFSPSIHRFDHTMMLPILGRIYVLMLYICRAAAVVHLLRSSDTRYPERTLPG